MKKNTFMALLLSAIVGNFSSSAYADTVTFGKPLEVFADPSDVVVRLDHAGSCGSNYFHIERHNVNFKELTAVVLTAFSSGKGLHFFVSSCKFGDRNVLSHGSARVE